eukprot:GHVU01155579.1.p1 GENE.GHVU01155579.1~~GHVU01155579.1.p1  ORF type:complete len:478 (-),score=55.77 GHVU01155579.1:716-2149(-)
MRPHAPLSPGSSSHSDSNEGFRSPGSEERTDEEATGVNDEKFREDMQNLSTDDLVIMCNRMHYSVENLKVLLNDELETERMLQEQKKQEEERLEVHLKSLHDIQVTSKSTKFYETDYRQKIQNLLREAKAAAVPVRDSISRLLSGEEGVIQVNEHLGELPRHHTVSVSASRGGDKGGSGPASAPSIRLESISPTTAASYDSGLQRSAGGEWSGSSSSLFGNVVDRLGGVVNSTYDRLTRGKSAGGDRHGQGSGGAPQGNANAAFKPKFISTISSDYRGGQDGGNYSARSWGGDSREGAFTSWSWEKATSKISEYVDYGRQRLAESRSIISSSTRHGERPCTASAKESDPPPEAKSQLSGPSTASTSTSGDAVPAAVPLPCNEEGEDQKVHVQKLNKDKQGVVIAVDVTREMTRDPMSFQIMYADNTTEKVREFVDREGIQCVYNSLLKLVTELERTCEELPAKFTVPYALLCDTGQE